ncbi:MAG: hypothetical protein IJ719_03950, partial [Clostridia bacterium]|nr:hypothetical protein [Clostridia bacterium]
GFHCAQCVICTMDIHADFEYSIHEVTSFACGKPRSWRISICQYTGKSALLQMLRSLHII